MAGVLFVGSNKYLNGHFGRWGGEGSKKKK